MQFISQYSNARTISNNQTVTNNSWNYSFWKDNENASMPLEVVAGTLQHGMELIILQQARDELQEKQTE